MADETQGTGTGGAPSGAGVMPTSGMLPTASPTGPAASTAPTACSMLAVTSRTKGAGSPAKMFGR